MKIIDGKALAAELRSQLKEEIEKKGMEVGLAVVIVGDNPASRIYVKNKIKACGEVGIRSFSYELPADATQNEVEELLDELGKDEKVHGILLQLPLPEGLDARAALKRIPYEKDVDGFSAENLGKLALGEKCTVACTPARDYENPRKRGHFPVGKARGRSRTEQNGGKAYGASPSQCGRYRYRLPQQDAGAQRDLPRGGYFDFRRGETEICDCGYGKGRRRRRRRRP